MGTPHPQKEISLKVGVVDGAKGTDGFKRAMQIDWEGGGGRVEQEDAEQGEEDEEDCEANLAGGAIGADLREVAVEKVAVEEDGEGKRQNEADEEAEPEISRWTVPEPNGVQEAHRGGHGVEVESGEKVPQGQQVAAGLIQGDEGHKGEVSGGSWGHGMPLVLGVFLFQVPV